MTAKEIYEPDPNSSIPTFVGWIIEDGNNLCKICVI
jgi:hypothetical protein